MGSARSEGHRKAILSTNGNGKACSFLIIVLFFYQISLCKSDLSFVWSWALVPHCDIIPSLHNSRTKIPVNKLWRDSLDFGEVGHGASRESQRFAAPETTILMEQPNTAADAISTSRARTVAEPSVRARESDPLQHQPS
jgi:hypothetical protein